MSPMIPSRSRPRSPLRLRLGLALAASGTLLLTGGTTPAEAAPPSGDSPDATASRTRGEAAPDGDDWSDADVLGFWTPGRIASATDPARPGPDDAPGGTPGPPAAVPGMPSAEHFPGIASVGVLFTSASPDPTTGEMRAHKCSASVVESDGRSLILTAGHCARGRAVFVPQYRSRSALGDQPYGFYRVTDWYVDDQYVRNSKGAVSDLDYSFGRLAPSPDGRDAQDVVGANHLVRTPGYRQDVTMLGYPRVGRNPADLPVRCAARSGRLSGFRQMRVECAGMWGGVSGGPWFSDVDWDAGTGDIIGNVGGYNGGGMNVPESDPRYNRITYSPVYGDRFFRLYADAQNGRRPHYGRYRQPKR
ncbi:trypsin-like peptidase domain-containing protein [Streptomyces sp. NPDC023838]|uniref:trypsin-like serine peptidase n=1 Tax=Streptomyces sp. NPDC023838 TaxID=3154325 RepID=UPI0033E0D8F6